VKRLLSFAAGSALLLVLTTPAWAQVPTGIVGSAHDFSDETTWNPSGEVCIVCHTPHSAGGAADGPLWNHTSTTTEYTPYSSPFGTLQGTIGTTAAVPTGVSKMCLSCHDGSIALNDFAGAAGTPVIIDAATGYNDISTITGLLDTDGSDDHPISITFTTATASADGFLHNPSSRTFTWGSATPTIQVGMLRQDKVECSSCHDVHNERGLAVGSALLKVTNAGSALCLTCHNK